MYINNDSPIGKYTLRAECIFGRSGKVIIEEHFTNEGANGLTFNSVFGNANGQTNPVPGSPAQTAELAGAAASVRYLKVYVDGMNNLCPRSSYTLTFHQYNNVACKCKNVGTLLNGATSIITESLAVNSRGSVANTGSTPQLVNAEVELALLPTQYNRVSALGGSCVLTLNDNCYRGGKSSCKKKPKKCAPSCPIKLCAPIQLVQYN